MIIGPGQKQLVFNQNDLDGPNNFGSIEGQGINIIWIFFSGQARILEDQFELLMDRLEKESYFHVQTNGKDYRWEF